MAKEKRKTEEEKLEKNKEKKENEKEVREEESKLEEDVEEAESEAEEKSEEFESEKFSSFVQATSERNIPRLERIRRTDVQDLEQNIASTPTEKETKEEIKYDTFNYTQADYASSTEQRESGTVHRDFIVKRDVERIERVGIERTKESLRDGAFINRDMGGFKESDGTFKKDYVASAERFKKNENRMPFEEPERKYKKMRR